MATITDWLINLGSILLLIVVTGSWLISIRSPKKSLMISSRWFALPPWAQVLLGFAAIALFVWLGSALWIPLPLGLSEPVTTVLHFTGLGIFLVGLFLALWARWALGAMYGVSTSSSAPLQEHHHLVQRGPYAFVRHPMYLGYWMVMFGVTLIYRTWMPLALLTVTVPSFYRRARREDTSLEEMFGEKWQAYAMNVPMFLPQWKRKREEAYH